MENIQVLGVVTYPVSVKQSITAGMVDDIMIGAFEGSINYWCNDATVVNAPPRADWPKSFDGDERTTAEMLSQGYALILDDGDDKHELTLDKFLAGCQIHADKEGFFDIDAMDATDYDNIIQYALFGKLVFG